MYLMKVGKREHLEMLREGHVHFNPLSLFRGDGTAYRGDELEGNCRIDVSKGIFINDVDISKIGSGLKATLSYQRSEDVLIFCAAVMDRSNFIFEGDQSIGPTGNFLREMRQFGQYALIFESEQFTASLSKLFKEGRCGFGYSKVWYVDKWNFDAVSAYFQDKKEILGDEAIYFLKDVAYERQNEWRFIVDCIGGHSTVYKNENGSLDITIPPFPVSDIIDLDELGSDFTADNSAQHKE